MSAEDSDAHQLKDVVMQLHRACTEMREELLAHRAALEQFLELRDGIVDLLANREAVLGATRVLGEIGDRTAELELSLAGVSDNTARHGRAITTLADQQKSTTATLDAAVRMVSQMVRSRSRSRGPAAAPVGNDNGFAASNPPLSVKTPRRSRAEVDYPDRLDNAAAAGMQEGFGTRTCASTASEEAWRWSAGNVEPDGGLMDHAFQADDAKYWSAGSSCASDALYARSGRVSAGNRSSWPVAASTARNNNNAPPGEQPPSLEMANCVKGVLARIEEALTKLDSNPASRDLGPDADPPWAVAQQDVIPTGSGRQSRAGHRTPRQSNTPQRAATPRESGAPQSRVRPPQETEVAGAAVVVPAMTERYARHSGSWG
mmetsp:Transcript_28662/g.66478  ORF Transcript_28662/g.66478 Transcript_28662/m.66478 type:complete len:374 (+) Transcript_28662:135-1256(+)|eukprot:CAMPEP_0178424524 /NCGR_PEP_ID=MMETSP0689_2-20121128/28253_1 /TAXON_ID=160604 /ORGANISM="Amphidinium massartii, Strain CS-259" /LENGTH=373 /DNA_ID=CAMNT_0020046161 /DNA_START=63 /DNA_END=1184 /DNA_ORIENTATION=-